MGAKEGASQQSLSILDREAMLLLHAAAAHHPARSQLSHMKPLRSAFQLVNSKTSLTTLVIGIGHTGIQTPSSIVSSSCSVPPTELYMHEIE